MRIMPKTHPQPLSTEFIFAFCYVVLLFAFCSLISPGPRPLTPGNCSLSIERPIMPLCSYTLVLLCLVPRATSDERRILSNKPNSPNAQINITCFMARHYDNQPPRALSRNKPKQTQFLYHRLRLLFIIPLNLIWLRKFTYEYYRPSFSAVH